MEHILRQLEYNLNAIRLPLGSPSQEPLEICKGLLAQLRGAHRDEYKRIALRCDTELCGDIMRLKFGSESEIVGYGADAVKDIIFDEMGFAPIDRYHLTQN